MESMFICTGSCEISHVGHTHTEHVDVLAKASTKRHIVDVEVKVTRHQDKEHLLGRNLST